MTNPVAEATAELAKRYLILIEDAVRDGQDAGSGRLSLMNLQWMCEEIISDGSSLPLDKISRWLGFIQGCLASSGLIDVDEERDVSRPMFHAAYRDIGILPPNSREKPD